MYYCVCFSLSIYIPGVIATNNGFMVIRDVSYTAYSVATQPSTRMLPPLRLFVRESIARHPRHTVSYHRMQRTFYIDCSAHNLGQESV